MKLIMGLAMIGVLGCSWQPPKDPYTLIDHMGGEPDVLNPILGQDVYESRVDNFIFDYLIVRDNKTLEFVPKIAWRWEVSDDHLEYIFHLRKDVTWHDGSALTADDVLFSYDRIRDPKVNAAHLRNYYQDIKALEKLDAHTVKFTYARPYFRALEFIGGMPILPRHLYGSADNQLKIFSENSWVKQLVKDEAYDFNAAAINRHPVGSGPYVFKKWASGAAIVLEANPNYWDQQHTPEIKRIYFKIVSNDTVALQMLKKGDLDYAGLRPIQWVKQTQSEKFQKKFYRFQYSSLGYRYIGWNAKRPWFKDASVRKALSHLINQKEIVEKLEFNLGEAATGPFSPQVYGYDHSLPPIEFNPPKAKQLLKAAGWEDHDGDGVLDKNGKPFRFTFLFPAGARFYERLGSIMKNNMARVGIDVTLSRIEWSVFLQKVNQRDFDAVSLGWSGSFAPDPYQIWHSSQIKEGHNFVSFQNAEADSLIEQVRVTFDQSERDLLLKRIHRIIYDEQPYTFLYATMSLVALDKRFSNVQLYRGGLDPLEWAIKAAP